MAYMDESCSTSQNPSEDGCSNNLTDTEGEETILVENNDEMNNEENDSHTGYTPFDDNMEDGQESRRMMMMEPTRTTISTTVHSNGDTLDLFSYQPIPTGPNDNNNNPAEQGDFYANISAFGRMTVENEEDVNQDFPIDFQALASQALRSLDEEYASTLRAEICHHNPPTVDPANESVVTNNNNHPNKDDAKNTTLFQERKQTTTTTTTTTIDEWKESQQSTDCQNNNNNNNNVQTTKEETECWKVEKVVEREVPSIIDTDAVRKAVEAIRLKSPDLTKNFDKWELDKNHHQQQQQQQCITHHTIIPKTPLSAFRRNSPKAIAATVNLTRAATLAEAYSRLFITLSSKQHNYLYHPPNNNNNNNNNNDIFVIHVVGADHVECQTISTIKSMFGPFVRWIGAMTDFPMEHIRIELIGPNVPDHASKRNPVNVMPTNNVGTALKIKTATVLSKHCLYHDYLREIAKDGTNTKGMLFPNIIIFYNAGIWGYNEWKPTLEAMCRIDYEVPAIITAYTLEEAEDDAEVIEDVILASHNTSERDSALSGKCLWNAQKNPFRSRKKRETVSAAKGRVYYENGAWQAWLFGQSKRTS